MEQKIKVNDSVVVKGRENEGSWIVFEVTGQFAHCWQLGVDERRPVPFSISQLRVQN